MARAKKSSTPTLLISVQTDENREILVLGLSGKLGKKASKVVTDAVDLMDR